MTTTEYEVVRHPGSGRVDEETRKPRPVVWEVFRLTIDEYEDVVDSEVVGEAPTKREAERIMRTIRGKT
jgi:hypothetical protein